VVIRSIPIVNEADHAARAADADEAPLHPRTADAAVEVEVEAKAVHDR
jgi:hypothetical protein